MRCIALLVFAGVLTAQDPAKVLVIYNANFPGSREVAEFYAQRRAVPAANLLACNCSTGAAIDYAGLAGWTAFWDEVRTPIVAKLAQLGETSIDVLLFCHGMPYQLSLPAANGGIRALDECLKTPFTIGDRTTPNPNSGLNPYYEPSPSLPPDLGRFDHGYKYANKNLWLIARLDGATPGASKDLVEGALYGERYLAPIPGYYRGKGYVDTRFKSYTDSELKAGYPFSYQSYAAADAAMAFGKFFVAASGYELKWENTALDAEIGEAGALFHDSTPAQTAPDALWYGGWYNYAKYHDVWTWLPGSCACDVDSNSLQGIRNPATVSFLTKAFARGLSCGTGCIAEPYLNGHPQPEKLLHFLLNGYTFAEAASLANPTFAWVNLVLGDPLYAPARAGRTPGLDTTPPPSPQLVVTGTGDTVRTVSASFDTRGREPDLATAVVDYGPTPAYGQTTGSGGIHRTQHDLPLPGLSAGQLYHFRVALRDPVGNRVQSPDAVLYTRAFAPHLAGTDPKTQTAVPPASAFVELSVGHKDTIGALSGVQVLLSAAHLNLHDVEVTGAVLALLTGYVLSPAGDLLSLRIAFPTSLPPGTYVLKLRVSAPGVTPAQDQAAIIVP